MKIAYFDGFSGAAGDMILGAFIDSGLSIDVLRAELAKLPLDNFKVSSEKVSRGGLRGAQFHVEIPLPEKKHRGLNDIREIINASALSASVVQNSLAIFQRLAEAEARVHGLGVDRVHFHEVGAVDAIVDIVGSCIALDLLRIDRVMSAPLNVGSGTVKCAHGILPVPAPATAELIKGFAVYSTHTQRELLTPTGAAILTTLAGRFGPMPELLVGAVGYGAGTGEGETPNLLRVIIGDTQAVESTEIDEQIAVIETNIDDMNPQIYDYLMEKLLRLGAMDVYFKHIQMKKNRPGVLISVLCRLGDVGKFAEMIMKETTTIGLRWRIENRIITAREIREVATGLGTLKFKIARFQDHIVNVAPEYEDCKRLAFESGLPLKRVLDEAKAAVRMVSSDSKDYTGS